MKKLKIVQLIGYGAPVSSDNKKSIGGVEVFLYDLIKNMDTTAFQHAVLYATDSPMIDKFKQNNVEVMFYPIKHKFSLLSIIKLGQLLKQRNIDIIHSHALRYDFAGAVISFITKIPLVITRHVAISDHLISFWKKMLFLIFDFFSMTVAKFVIGISDDARNKIRRSHFINPKKVLKIYCGIDLKKYHKNMQKQKLIKKRFKIDSKDFIIGTVAQLREYKGIDVLLRAAPRVLANHRNVKFLIIGGGPEKQNLENLAKQLRIAENVIFAGFQKDIFTWISFFDIFALTSRREGLPIAILEAMYAETPVLASSVGAVGEVVKNDYNGKIVDPDDHEQVADKLVELMANRQKLKQYGKNSHYFVVKNFNINRAVDNYQTLFRKIIFN